MSWQSDIVSAIKADAPVASLIGAKVFADIAPGNAKAPFIVYQSISDGSNTTFDGIRNVIFPLVQFSCWAATKSGAIDLSSKLSAAIEGQTIAGGSDLSFTFSNQISSSDQQTKLFGEVLDLRGSCNAN
jgi:hypothetical protein|tara:strand:+ start:792 stop:1178 length:387 start_codon:yes stop_codon:yes gene_type:complete